jgi:hypothetical protein
MGNTMSGNAWNVGMFSLSGISKITPGIDLGEMICEKLKESDKEIQKLSGAEVAIIINDSGGCPAREGSVGEAIGISGIRHLEEPKGQDLYGNSISPKINGILNKAIDNYICKGNGDYYGKAFKIQQKTRPGSLPGLVAIYRFQIATIRLKSPNRTKANCRYIINAQSGRLQGSKTRKTLQESMTRYMKASRS